LYLEAPHIRAMLGRNVCTQFRRTNYFGTQHSFGVLNNNNYYRAFSLCNNTQPRRSLQNQNNIRHNQLVFTTQRFIFKEFASAFKKNLKKNIEQDPEFGGDLKRLQETSETVKEVAKTTSTTSNQFGKKVIGKFKELGEKTADTAKKVAEKSRTKMRDATEPFVSDTKKKIEEVKSSAEQYEEFHKTKEALEKTSKVITDAKETTSKVIKGTKEKTAKVFDPVNKTVSETFKKVESTETVKSVRSVVDVIQEKAIRRLSILHLRR